MSKLQNGGADGNHILKSRHSIKEALFGTAVLDTEKLIWENAFSSGLEEVC
jgi:hypothetical protein